MLDFHYAVPLRCRILNRLKGQLNFPSILNKEIHICRNHYNLMNIINMIIASFAGLQCVGADKLFESGDNDEAINGLL